jgi:hypothetical protein
MRRGFKKEEVHFWPSNYFQSLILTIEHENQKSLALELLKPFIFGHPAVLQGGFGDVATTWRRAHMSSPSLLPSPSSLFSLLSPPPAANPRASGCPCTS